VKNIESHCDMKHAAASVCFAALILTRSIWTKAARPRAAAAAKVAYIKKVFAIRAGIIDSLLLVESLNH
jgi:hypothetical protein